MIATRLGTFLLLAALSTAQQTPAPADATSRIPKPKLPVIDDKACPRTSGRPIVEDWKIRRNDEVYSSWQDNRVSVGVLKPGDKVTVLAGVNVVREPDIARITQLGVNFKDRVAGSSLKPGDEVLGYGFHGNGDMDFWGKGVWFTEYYEEIVAKGSNCGFADQSECSIQIIKNGVSEWWVQLKTGRAKTSWVLAGKSTGDKSWRNPNFDDLCTFD